MKFKCLYVDGVSYGKLPVANLEDAADNNNSSNNGNGVSEGNKTKVVERLWHFLNPESSEGISFATSDIHSSLILLSLCHSVVIGEQTRTN